MFGQVYEKAANSQAARDYKELSAWLKGTKAPATVRNFAFDPDRLRDVTPKQRSLYCGSICLILQNGPRDFHKLGKVTGDMMIDQRVDDHHVFPIAFLRGLPAPPSERLSNCVLNRTLIDRQTNIRIGKRAPSDYLAEIKDELGGAKVDTI